MLKINQLIKIVRQAGNIAESMIDNSAPVLKPDKTVLTQADREVSRFLKRSVGKLLKNERYVFIDEEDEGGIKSFNQSDLESASLVCAVDPIDGTRAYSNRMPNYGISIGVLKKLTPWIGVVYMPGLRELYFCDGRQAFFIKDPFTPEQKKTEILPVDVKITRQSMFIVNDSFFQKYNWDLKFCQTIMPTCAVIDLCWPAVGRACGCIFDAHIWDMAGAWPVFQAAGLQLFSLTTGKVLDSLHTGLFIGKGSKTWRLKEAYLLCSPRNFSLICKAMSFRNQ